MKHLETRDGLKISKLMRKIGDAVVFKNQTGPQLVLRFDELAAGNTVPRELVEGVFAALSIGETTPSIMAEIRYRKGCSVGNRPAPTLDADDVPRGRGRRALRCGGGENSTIS